MLIKPGVKLTVHLERNLLGVSGSIRQRFITSSMVKIFKVKLVAERFSLVKDLNMARYLVH